MNSRLMKYNEVRGVRFVLTKDKTEAEVVFDERYEYIRIEDLQSTNNIAVYINDAEEDDYVLLHNIIEFQDIAVKKIKVRLINNLNINYDVQVIVMR